MRKKIIFYFLLFLISIFILESLLRLAGFKPWKSEFKDHQSIFEFDSKLGWISKEGEYLINSSDSAKMNKFTIEKRSNRSSGKPKENTRKEVVLIGGSFTQGAGVSDEETFAHHLQILLPKHKILNFGQAGYSTIQSFLLLNRILKPNDKKSVVIYGFITHHLRRNVARGEWLEILQKSTNTGFTRKPSIPFGVIDKRDNLIIKPRTSYLTLPLREKSSLITVVEKVYMKQTTRYRKKYQKKVFLKTVLEMRAIAKKNNNEFIVVNLGLDKKDQDDFLIEMSKKNKLNYLDCRTPDFEPFKLKNEYHPNNVGHKHFSKCISNFLSNKLLL